MSRHCKFARRVRLVEPSAVREILRVLYKPDVISFAGGLPDPATFPVEEVKEAVREVLEEKWNLALQYCQSEGIEELRREIANFMMRRGVVSSVKVEEILITSGSQEALFLIAQLLLDKDDLVVTERPTYLAMLQVLYAHEAKVVSVEMDENGIDTYKLEEKLRKLRQEGKTVKLLYLVPTCQNPTGVTMSIDRRKHVVELAEEFDLYIVEDDPYSYYLYEPINVKAIKEFDKSGRVIYVSTFSKILVPGFRIGWLVADPEIVRELVKLKQVLNLQTNTFTQYVTARLLRKGAIDNRLPKLAEYYRKKRDVMLEALEEYMSDLAEWTNPVGGMFIWVKLRRPDLDTKKMLIDAIEKYKVAYVPGEPFYPENPEKNTLRLNFTYPTIEQIKEGIERLSKLVKEYM